MGGIGRVRRKRPLTCGIERGRGRNPLVEVEEGGGVVEVEGEGEGEGGAGSVEGLDGRDGGSWSVQLEVEVKYLLGLM